MKRSESDQNREDDKDFGEDDDVGVSNLKRLMLTEEKMRMRMMREKMARMMSSWVTHGPARCSPGPAQLTKLASGGSAG